MTPDDWPVCASCNTDLTDDEIERDLGLCDVCAQAEAKADADLERERDGDA